MAGTLRADPARVRPVFDRFPVLSAGQIRRRLEPEILCGDGPRVGLSVRRYCYSPEGGAMDRTVPRLGALAAYLGDREPCDAIRRDRLARWRYDAARAGQGRPNHPRPFRSGRPGPAQWQEIDAGDAPGGKRGRSLVIQRYGHFKWHSFDA